MSRAVPSIFWIAGAGTREIRSPSIGRNCCSIASDARSGSGISSVVSAAPVVAFSIMNVSSSRVLECNSDKTSFSSALIDCAIPAPSEFNFSKISRMESAIVLPFYIESRNHAHF